MFPLDLSYLRPNLGDKNRLYWRYLYYIGKVLGIEPADLIGYWPMNENCGTNADNAEGTALRDGTFLRDVSTMGIGAGIGDSNTAPVFDGINDYLNVKTSSFRDAFNGAEGTMIVWAKVANAGVWTNGNRAGIITLVVDGDNNIIVRKDTGNNELDFVYVAGATNVNVTKSSVSDTGWFHLALTWNKIADAVKAYYNGVQEGSTLTGLGIWAGILATEGFGASSITPANPFPGNLAHGAVWKKALTPAQILSLATV